MSTHDVPLDSFLARLERQARLFEELRDFIKGLVGDLHEARSSIDETSGSHLEASVPPSRLAIPRAGTHQARLFAAMGTEPRTITQIWVVARTHGYPHGVQRCAVDLASWAGYRRSPIRRVSRGLYARKHEAVRRTDP